MKPDDSAVCNDEVLYRYSPSIPHKYWAVVDQETQEVQITLAALSWDDDGISCYRKLILNQHEMDWTAVKREPKNVCSRWSSVMSTLWGLAWLSIPILKRTNLIRETSRIR